MPFVTEMTLITTPNASAAAAVREHQAGGPPSAGAQIRQDLRHLPGGRWAIWRIACLRAAGFPAGTVLKLSSPASARLAVGLLRCRTPETRAAFAETFAAERLRVRAALRDLAADERFRQAVLWQNRRAFRHALAALAATPIEQVDSDLRKKELLIASYAQRYSVKNDTIGFFGPVGWARLSDNPDAVTVRNGQSLLASRTVYFESWCIDTIARVFDSRPELRPWRVPRVPATVRLDGTHLKLGSRIAAHLSPSEARLFRACDGSRDAQDLSREIQTVDPSAFGSDDAVFRLLEEWHRAGYVIWSFEGPRELHPERTLRSRLELIDDRLLRERTLSELARMEGARDTVRAASCSAALERALETLDSSFSQLTGSAPTRFDGQSYAARTLVYEDCRRDASVELGVDVVRRLGPPLSLVLQSLRWAVDELARRHAAEFQRVFDGLSRGGGRVVTLASFFARTSLAGDTRGAMSTVASDVRAELERRWAGVLGAPPAARRIDCRSRDLRAAVRSAFATPGPPPSSWAGSISPDIMIDADSADAIRRGDYRIVIGEIHPYNTLPQSVFMTQCPHAAEIVGLLECDAPAARVHWLAPKDAAPQRVQYVIRSDDYVYVSTRESSPVPVSRTLRVADLSVVGSGDELFVESQDGFRLPYMEFVGYLMMRKAVNLFGLLPPQPHRPRIAIDGVVVGREQWEMPASAVAFATRGNELDRFVECQQWAHEHGIPRHVFTRMPNERKPVYLDLSSPLFVDLFARSIRTLRRTDPSALVTITEMLPAPSGAWLADNAGQHYTSELRVVAVDPFVARCAPAGNGRTA